MREATVTAQPPAQSYIIKRPRLTKLLDESGARIILLCAPAGYGKTTLAREWVASRPERTVWFSGRPAIADVAALATDLAATFRSNSSAKAADSVSEVESLVAQGQPPRVLARALAAANPPGRDEILVIDDYHHAGTRDADELLPALLEVTDFRLLLTSRVLPSWFAPRLEIYGHAVVLGIRDLAFTDEEARAVLSAENASIGDALLAQASGWPALIGLAAIRGTPVRAADALEPGTLYEFFADDLLRSATPRLQEALQIFALLGDDVELSKPLLGDDYAECLSEATRRGFFARADNRAFSMHPLLRAFLIQRLRELPMEDVSARVTTVIRVLVRERRWDDCFAIAQAFPLPQCIFPPMSAALYELLDSGRLATVKRWTRIANSTDESSPLICLAEAEVALRERDVNRAQVLAELAGTGLQDAFLASKAYLTAARAAHLREDGPAVTSNVQRTLELAPDAQTRARALWIAFLHALEQQELRTESLLDDLSEALGANPEDTLRRECARGLIEVEIGDPKQALAICEKAYGLLTRVRDPLLRTNFRNLYSFATIVRADYQRTLALCGEQLAEAESSGLDFVTDHALLSRAAALIGLRKLGEAQRTLNEVQRRMDDAQTNVAVNHALMTARLRLSVTDFEGAAIHLERDISEYLPRALRGEFLAYRGLVRAVSGDEHGAKRTFADALRTSRYIDARAIAALGRAILALRAGVRDAETQAARVLQQTVNTHADAVVAACRAFPALASVGAAQPAVASALRDVLLASRDIDIGRRAGLVMPRELRQKEGLSPRERDVYELMVQGRTNREIAKALFISESTTKVHMRHIFEKLGVHSRAEAAKADVEESES